MDKVDEVIKKIVADFEAKPFATTIKGVLVLIVLKEAMKWWKK